MVIRMEVLATDLLKSAGDQVDAILKAMSTVVKAEGDEIEKLFLQVTKHWNKSKFDGFTKVFKEDSNEMSSTVGSEDLILFFINNGTSERFAIMSSDWQSQTAPRTLSSQPGAGRVIARGRRMVPNPMPGIEARHFDEEIVKKRQPIFVRNLEASVIAVTKSIT